MVKRARKEPGRSPAGERTARRRQPSKGALDPLGLVEALAAAQGVSQVLAALVRHGAPHVRGAALLRRCGRHEAVGSLEGRPLDHAAFAEGKKAPPDHLAFPVAEDAVAVLDCGSRESADACRPLVPAAALALRSAYLHGRLQRMEQEDCSEASLAHAVIEGHDHALAVLDHGLRLVRCNGRFREVFVPPQIRCEGAALSRLIPDPDLELLVRRGVEKGEAIREVEFAYNAGPENVRYFLVSISEVPLSKGPGVMVVFNEVTEWKRRQLQVMEASRLVSVGEMAAGIAHEINNPLAAIMGFSQLILRQDLPAVVKRDVEKILSEARKASKVVANLQSFARRHRPRKEYVDLGAVLQKVVDTKSFELRVNNIDVVTRIAPDLPMTMADQQQMAQVFLNIIVNAQQAMMEDMAGGTLLIEARAVDDRLRFTFADDGAGIPEEHLPKIFDPFFTTKPVGTGTGLGLSTCYGIVHEHGGTIRAENRPGGGAVFVVELPILQEPVERRPSSKPSQEQDRSRGLNILVVDDEPAIVEFLARILRDEGHTVDCAASGEEALNMPALDRYDAILLDVKMPGIGGARLFDHLQTLSEDLAHRVIFITGDTSDPSTREIMDRSDNPVLPKPFTLEDLDASLRRVTALAAMEAS